MKLAQYTREQRTEIDRHLAAMTAEQLDELDTQGGRILAQTSETPKEKQREYQRRYRQRIALAKQMGIISLPTEGETL